MTGTPHGLNVARKKTASCAWFLPTLAGKRMIIKKYLWGNLSLKALLQ
jgi:hypothetical protein